MTDINSTSPKGIGGWLYLVILGLVISPVRIAYYLISTYWPIFRDGAWAELTTVGTAAYHPFWAPLLIFEIVGNLVSIALAIVTLVFLLKRSKYTPRLAITLYAWIAIFVIIDFFAANLIPALAAHPNSENTKELLRAIIYAGIWIPYFLVSKRVKATFI